MTTFWGQVVGLGLKKGFRTSKQHLYIDRSELHTIDTGWVCLFLWNETNKNHIFFGHFGPKSVHFCACGQKLNFRKQHHQTEVYVGSEPLMEGENIFFPTTKRKKKSSICVLAGR